MKFSAQEEYGLRCLLAIGRTPSGASLSIPEISRSEGLTEPHVAKLLMILRKGGFIASTRGQGGGYTLARPASEIVIGDVLAELGGRLYEDDFCERHSGRQAVCAHLSGCSIKTIWSTVQQAVDQVLNNVTLADILQSERSAAIELYDQVPANLRDRSGESVEATV
jgi:Rrf2 family protein